MSGRATASAVLLGAAFLLGCSGESPAPGGERAGVLTEDSRSCAPRVIAHRHGETRIEGVPRRIVPVTVRDQDVLLAFDRLPVAVQDGYYALPYASWPWVAPELAASDPVILPAERLNFEQVAALRPDLILGAASGMSEEEYRVLSRIAPTLGQAPGHMDYGVPWDELTRTVGRAICAEERAETLVAETDALFDEVRDRHPALEGAVGVVAMPGGPDGALWVYAPEDARGRLISRLGLEHPPELRDLTADHFVAVVSRERMDLIDVDVLVWLATDAQRRDLERDPVYMDLAVVRRDAVVYLDPEGPLVAAITNSTPSNLPYALDALVPRLAEAAGAGTVAAEGS